MNRRHLTWLCDRVEQARRWLAAVAGGPGELSRAERALKAAVADLVEALLEPPVFSVATRAVRKAGVKDWDDVQSDASEAVRRMVRALEARRHHFQTDGQVRGYLWRTAHRVGIDRQRGEGRRSRVWKHLITYEPVERRVNKTLIRELMLRVESIMESWTQEQRTIVRLKLLEGFSAQEVAEYINRKNPRRQPPMVANNVFQIFGRVMARLRKQLEDEGWG